MSLQASCLSTFILYDALNKETHIKPICKITNEVIQSIHNCAQNNMPEFIIQGDPCKHGSYFVQIKNKSQTQRHMYAC